MGNRAAVFHLLLFLTYSANSLKIAFYEPSSPGADIQFQQYPTRSTNCVEIPPNKVTGQQNVDDIVLRSESSTLTLLAFYAIPNNPKDPPCSRKNLQIIAVFPRNIQPNIEQFFTPIWSRLSHWRKLTPGSEEWRAIDQPTIQEGDVVNRSGSGWYIEKKQISARKIENISPEIRYLVHEADQGQQPGIKIPRTSNNFRPRKTISDPQGLRDQIFQLSNEFKRQATTPSRNLKLDEIEMVENLPDMISLMRFMDDNYLDSLGPQGYTDYTNDIAGVQKTIKQKGGYLPVPLGIRHRYDDKKLNRIGFNVVPVGEERLELERQADPFSYYGRFAGMGRMDLLGEYVPTISDWEEKGGMLTVNTQVQSPRRLKSMQPDESGMGILDSDDLNHTIQKHLTSDELYRYYTDMQKPKVAPSRAPPEV